MPEQKKILIVEDEIPLSKALELKLTKAGYIAKRASNGEEGLEMLKAEHFDMVLLDLMMPKMDGFGLLKNIQDLNMNIPAVVVSNLGQNSDIDKVKELGAREFFIKSNTPLVKIVEYIENTLKDEGGGS